MKKFSAVLMCIGCGFGLSGCDNVNRSLIFFTNTTVGVEAGIDPTASSGKVIIGYKRAEGVINPVYQPPISKCYTSAGGPNGSHSQTNYSQVEDPEDVYRDEAYSVLAKIAGETGGRGTAGPNASVDAAGKVSQWFATGKAADYLAKNEYAAAALTGSDNVARAISDSPKLGSELAGPWQLGALAQLDKVRVDLSKVAATNKEAERVIAELDDEAEDLKDKIGTVIIYQWDDVREKTKLVPMSWPATRLDSSGGWFREIVLLANERDQSVAKLDQLLSSNSLKLDGQPNPRLNAVADAAGNVTISVDTAADKAIREAILSMDKALIKFSKTLTSDKDFMSVMKRAFDVWSNLYFQE